MNRFDQKCTLAYFVFLNKLFRTRPQKASRSTRLVSLRLLDKLIQCASVESSIENIRRAWVFLDPFGARVRSDGRSIINDSLARNWCVIHTPGRRRPWILCKKHMYHCINPPYILFTSSPPQLHFESRRRKTVLHYTRGQSPHRQTPNDSSKAHSTIARKSGNAIRERRKKLKFRFAMWKNRKNC